MSKYNYEIKLKIVKENEIGYGGSYLAKKHSINLHTLKNWVEAYKMYGEKVLKKSMSKSNYSGEFKLSVLEYKKNYKLSYKETAALFGIKNSSIIANWIGNIANNLLNRKFEVNKPNEVWVTDITEFKIHKSEIKLYLSPIMDLFNSEIISFSLSTSPNIAFTNQSLTEAIAKLPSNHKLMIHTDQGFHYQHIS